MIYLQVMQQLILQSAGNITIDAQGNDTDIILKELMVVQILHS